MNMPMLLRSPRSTFLYSKTGVCRIYIIVSNFPFKTLIVGTCYNRHQSPSLDRNKKVPIYHFKIVVVLAVKIADVGSYDIFSDPVCGSNVH